MTNAMQEMRAGNPVPAREETPTAKALGHLNFTIGQLDDALAQLINQLKPALHPGVQETDRPKPVADGASELVQTIDHQRSRIDDLLNTVHDINQRIEL